MPRFRVRTREVSYRQYFVTAKDEHSIDIEGLDGDEYGYDIDITEVECVSDDDKEEDAA
jgi:hypothetical protein